LTGIDPNATANDLAGITRPEARRQLRDSYDSGEDLPMIEPNQDDVQESRDRTTSTKPSPSAQPTVMGRFKIIRFLAQGGYCGIYEVTASDAIDQRLALKLVNRETESVSRWFEKAASVTANLNHAHILPCHESGRIDGQPYMVMPLVDGVSVHDLARQQALPTPAEIVRIARSIASALDYAHQCGVVHGNVHPKHVLMDRTGHVWLIGFAEVGPGYPHEICFGNPHHLAPEQFTSDGKTVPQTDIYALGEIVFLLLSRYFPFQNLTTHAMFDCKRFGPVPSIGKYRPELPRRIDRVLQQAMAVRPENRFRSAGEFVAELDAALDGTARPSDEADKKWWQLWR